MVVQGHVQAVEDLLFPNIAFLPPPDATPREYIAARKEVIGRTFR